MKSVWYEVRDWEPRLAGAIVKKYPGAGFIRATMNTHTRVLGLIRDWAMMADYDFGAGGR